MRALARAVAAAATGRRATTAAPSFFPPPALHPPPSFPPTCRLLDGAAVAAAWCDEMAPTAAALTAARGRAPSLAVVLAGERADSLLYVQRKLEAAARIGIDARVVRPAPGASQAEIEACVAGAAADGATDGVVVQLPLPPGVDADAVLARLPPSKDVDGFHPANVGRLLTGGGAGARAFVPATALGVLQLLRRSGVRLPGMHAVVLGDSAAVGLPLAMLLRRAGVAATTLCHRGAVAPLFDGGSGDDSTTRAAAGACGPNAGGERGAAGTPAPLAPLAALVAQADLLVSALGSPAAVRAAWVKRGAVVVDVGINVLPPAHPGAPYAVVGDVDPAASAHAGAMTPVPGGVGPMTIAALLANTLQAAGGGQGVGWGAGGSGSGAGRGRQQH